jgi:hypothetical protein
VPSDVNSAQVVIRRQRALSGSIVAWKVLVDGQEAGTLHNGGSLTVDAAPGRHTVIVEPPSIAMSWSRSEPFAVDVEPGGRVELVARVPAWGRLKISREGTAPSRTGWADLLDRAAGASARWSADRPRDTEVSTPPPRGPAATAPRPPAAVTSKIVEGSRYEVSLGDETRTIDNSRSTSPTTRQVRLTREWARTCAVDAEHITTVHGSAGLRIHVLDLKAEAERTLRKNYSTTSEERETFEEVVTLNILEHTRSEIVFSWKEIRQKGTVQVAGEGFEAQVPFEVVVGLTFDQQQIDSSFPS